MNGIPSHKEENRLETAIKCCQSNLIHHNQKVTRVQVDEIPTPPADLPYHRFEIGMVTLCCISACIGSTQCQERILYSKAMAPTSHLSSAEIQPLLVDRSQSIAAFAFQTNTLLK